MSSFVVLHLTTRFTTSFLRVSGFPLFVAMTTRLGSFTTAFSAAAITTAAAITAAAITATLTTAAKTDVAGRSTIRLRIGCQQGGYSITYFDWYFLSTKGAYSDTKRSVVNEVFHDTVLPLDLVLCINPSGLTYL